MSFRILPKDPKFFELFITDGDNLAEAAVALHEMVDAFDRLDDRVATIQGLEKRGDEIDREVNRRLGRVYIERGKPEDAARAWRKALALEPGDKVLAYELAELERDLAADRQSS